jgi:hypothetical protein
VPSTNSREDPIAAYLAEYDFVGSEMRQNQRERHGFLAFALTASGLILGILMRSNPPRSATEACFLIGLAAGVTLIAERMTIRASQSIAAAGAYLRLFVEPHVDGLEFQQRLASPLRGTEVGSSTGSFSLAYIGLTAAFVLAWPAVPIDGARHWWQTLVVVVLGGTSLFQALKLSSMPCPVWSNAADSPWRAIHDQDQQTGRLHASSAVPQARLPSTNRRGAPSSTPRS